METSYTHPISRMIANGLNDLAGKVRTKMYKACGSDLTMGTSATVGPCDHIIILIIFCRFWVTAEHD